MKIESGNAAIWVSRLLIAVVTFLNLQAAVFFMARPQDYAPAFELNGVPGAAMIRGVGLLFLMWNIPYVFALIHPLRNFVSLVEAVIMQALGVIGESLILIFLVGEHPIIQSSVIRFIIFDGGGLVLLCVAFVQVIRVRRKKSED